MTPILIAILNGSTLSAAALYDAAGLSMSDWSLSDPDQCSRRFLLGVLTAAMFNDETFDDADNQEWLVA